MNERVSKSNLLFKKYHIKNINISYSNSIKDLGRFQISKGLKFFKYFFLLTKELLFFKPDLIYFQISTTGLSFIRDSLYVFMMKLFNKKIVFHLRSKGIKRAIKNKFVNNYYKFVFRNVHCICLSDALVGEVDEICNKKIFVVNNGIPIANTTNLNVERIENNILFLSNIMKEKGIFDFLDALEILLKKRINFRGTIVGEEGDIGKELLLNEIKVRKLDNCVEYIGPKYSNDKFKEYLKSDIFVFPTYYNAETFGGVIIEAMQFKLPVISTNIVSIPYIIDNSVTGYIVEKNQPNEIANRLKDLINDKDKKIKMGLAGYRKFLDHYTFEKFELNMDNVFKTILDIK
jgi:glycosyltransferase involved in cell wall biosynthesis